MLMSRKAKKYTALSLTIIMLLSLIPDMWTGRVQAAAKDIEVVFKSGARIGNLSYSATNTFINFYNNQVEGFRQTETDKDASYDWASGDIFAGDGSDEATVQFEIRVADNPILREMAKSGHAEVLTGFNILRRHYKFFSGSRESEIRISIDGRTVIHENTDDGNEQKYNKSATAIINPNSVIHVWLYGEGSMDGEGVGVRGLYFNFQDLQRPVLKDYTFTGNGATRENTTINQTELYVKKNENVTVAYNFTEPVKPTSLVASNSEFFLRHPLFMNPAGTGLPGAGQMQYLENITYFNRGNNDNNLASLYNQIAFSYSPNEYSQSGNLPVEPKIAGTTPNNPPMEQTMQEKFTAAGLADAAGNMATISFPNAGSSASLPNVQGKTVDPFNYKSGGYRVIVDAVRPKYTKVGNGIQPEILTGVTLNEGDVIDFTVQMTEEAVVKKGWVTAQTFLRFNNGMKAYYTGGSNTKNWTFRMTVPGGKEVEAPLLKVIALSHDSKGDNTDINVIQDYAGNLLFQPANYDGEHVDGDTSLVNSKIDWANLSIDNTLPIIGYRYETGGGSNTTYQKKGKVTIDANDPAVKVPSLDPIAADRGLDRPSRGIYRPSNMTGSASPSVGLVYYLWSQSPADPFATVAEDNYAALKRYALSAKQPSEELYPNEFQDIKLQVANNKTNLLAPPAEAFTSENSGEWYLHTWTADMTWDSARELKQYELKQQYVREHDEQYKAWLAEAPGTEDEKILYADNKALVAVGQYGDTNVWKLDYFKKDDSNWTHNVGILKLDNQVPSIANGTPSNDNSNSVEITALVSDPHSGIDTVKYQWVKDGNQPADVDWKPANYNGTTVTQSTYEDVFEDGSYWLYLKAADKAGNEITDVAYNKTVTVNSQDSMPAEFTPPSNPNYVQSHDVMFSIGGITPDFVGYAITGSSNHPAGDSEFTALEPAEMTGKKSLLEASPSPSPSSSAEAGSGGAEATPTPTPAPAEGSGGNGPEITPAPTPAADPAVEPAVGAVAGPAAMMKLLSVGLLNTGSFKQVAVNTLEATPTPAPEASATPAPTAAPEASPSADAELTEGADQAAMLLAAEEEAEKLTYLIPADATKNGVQYVHLIVKQGDKAYYYSKAYYFDNEPSSVTYSKNGVNYPLPKQSLSVTVSELYSKTGAKTKYQWVKADAPAPDAVSQGWTDLPLGGAVEITGKDLKPGEVADYILYVWSVDGAGNSVVSHTPESFKVSASGDKDAPPAAAESALLYLSGDEEDGYTAIVKLSLDTEDKAGYEYSISPDNGASWVNWKPYTNFVSVKVPTGNPAFLEVMVKYRTPGGKISDAAKLKIPAQMPEDAPVYALASMNTTSPVNATVGANIEVAVPAGVKVIVGKVNPTVPVRTGNTFNVKENGFYSFDLIDLNDAERTDTLYVVVKNVDGTAPMATVEYPFTALTNSNVTAQLVDPSEPIIITNNNGKSSYTFTENGSFTFEFKDAAGNTGTAVATVNNIDKEAPKVKIVRSYQYGADGSQAFGTIKDSNGNVVLSSGVTLEVQKADNSAKQIFITSQNQTVSMKENGVASFTVADQFGNTTVIKETVTNILNTAPDADKITYTFVDAAGKAVPDSKIVTIGGQEYAQGKVKVTVSGKTTAPNMVFSGLKPIQSGASYTNKISAADGTFTYSREFESAGSTVMTISDLLGNSSKIPVTVKGLDNTAPELTLKKSAVGIAQNKQNFNFAVDLGGYTVSDNVSAAANVKVAITGLDLTKLGRQQVTYTATDQVGNKTVATQDVIVVKDGGLLIFGDDTLISASSGESALFSSNTITFKISGYNTMKVSGADKVNEWGTFDLMYQSGLYREGQMKTIATKITYDQLVSGQYKVTFPKAGWYTIIVRTQERDREYATFFVSSTN
ncbi:hypothetical protein [Paenibacillus typhae]|uniref:Uncharacterized protein n=1 Tax=Paenibacillus typhae TaxID=1174501 RepID=A0A1G8ERS6_9BACL|nr:hypothetical protein [Paenibacillus typhae]SDH72601.1 hypothetical protein SAMN05216192_1017 [Paenibacillus typhae]